MPRVTWNPIGGRLFHAGVDRGMLYVGPYAVPWSGLTEVIESPSGGAPTPYYLDGLKVLNIASSEEFAATINAVASPVEFAPCAGRIRLSTALFATDQPKNTFGFSYRTLIGNDLLGTKFAYKIHVVYNALAKISDFSHGTVDDSPTLNSYSWAIDTVPEIISGYKPTSHLVIDSRVNSDDIMSQVEAILYGDDDNDPRLPGAQELVTLLGTQ
jgi:hypothetical protein